MDIASIFMGIGDGPAATNAGAKRRWARLVVVAALALCGPALPGCMGGGGSDGAAAGDAGEGIDDDTVIGGGAGNADPDEGAAGSGSDNPQDGQVTPDAGTSDGMMDEEEEDPPVDLDETPPGPVTGFGIAAIDQGVVMYWNNPSDDDFAGTEIRYIDGDTAPADADSAFLAYRGEDEVEVMGAMMNGTEFAFSAFAFDSADNYSTAETATATPVASPNQALDQACESDDTGYRIWNGSSRTQTFVPDDSLNAHPVLSRVALMISKKGTPPWGLTVRLIDVSLDTEVWSVDVAEADISASKAWLVLDGDDGEGDVNARIPYAVLVNGRTYRIEVEATGETPDASNSYSWRSSAAGDCNEPGEGVAGKDYMFQTHRLAKPLLF